MALDHKTITGSNLVSHQGFRHFACRSRNFGRVIVGTRNCHPRYTKSPQIGQSKGRNHRREPRLTPFTRLLLPSLQSNGRCELVLLRVGSVTSQSLNGHDHVHQENLPRMRNSGNIRTWKRVVSLLPHQQPVYPQYRRANAFRHRYKCGITGTRILWRQALSPVSR